MVQVIFTPLYGIETKSTTASLIASEIGLPLTNVLNQIEEFIKESEEGLDLGYETTPILIVEEDDIVMDMLAFHLVMMILSAQSDYSKWKIEEIRIDIIHGLYKPMVIKSDS